MSNADALRQCSQRESRNRELEKQSLSWVTLMLCEPLFEGTTAFALPTQPTCSLRTPGWSIRIFFSLFGGNNDLCLSAMSPGGHSNLGEQAPPVGQWHQPWAVSRPHYIQAISSIIALDAWVSFMFKMIQVIPVCSKVRANSCCRRGVVPSWIKRKN